MNGEMAALEFADGSIVTALFDPVTRLSMFHFFDDANVAVESLEIALHACVTEESNQNLSRAKKEMLRWHWRLGHPGMNLVKWLTRRGLLGQMSGKISVFLIKNIQCAQVAIVGSNQGDQPRQPERERCLPSKGI